MNLLRTRAPSQESRPSEAEPLLRRLDLIAKAEEQAAISAERARLVRAGDVDQLQALPVTAVALQQSFACDAETCANWAEQAKALGDVLLARALHRLADSLTQASNDACSLNSQAEDFVASLDETA